MKLKRGDYVKVKAPDPYAGKMGIINSRAGRKEKAVVYVAFLDVFHLMEFSEDELIKLPKPNKKEKKCASKK